MRLKLKSFGDPKSCEPAHVRIAFPGGDVEVVRAYEGAGADYWVHIRVNRPGHCDPDDDRARITEARLDDTESGVIALPDAITPTAYHLAVRVTQVDEKDRIFCTKCGVEMVAGFAGYAGQCLDCTADKLERKAKR